MYFGDKQALMFITAELSVLVLMLSIIWVALLRYKISCDHALEMQRQYAAIAKSNDAMIQAELAIEVLKLISNTDYEDKRYSIETRKTKMIEQLKQLAREL